MKKLYFFIASSVFALSLDAQVQLTEANHAPVAGDQYDMFQCDSLNVVPGPAGAGAVWNFSTIPTHSSIVMSYTGMANTNATYASASVAVAASANNTSYYLSNSNGLFYYGGNITAGTVSGQITYTAPAVYASYPMTISTSSSSAIGGTINVVTPLSATGSFGGNSHVVADASGTLMLPGTNATFTNVLRVTTSQTINVVTMFANATLTMVNYDFYTPGIKATLFTISTATAVSPAGTNSQTYVYRNKNASVQTATSTIGIPTNSIASEDFVVYPNPSSSVVTFSGDNKVVSHITIFDLAGRQVDEVICTDGKANLDVSKYKKGIYQYHVTNAGGHTYKTGKITVTE